MSYIHIQVFSTTPARHYKFLHKFRTELVRQKRNLWKYRTMYSFLRHISVHGYGGKGTYKFGKREIKGEVLVGPP